MDRRSFLGLSASALGGCATVGDPNESTPSPSNTGTASSGPGVVWNGEDGQGLDQFLGDLEKFSTETDDPISGSRSLVGEGSPHGGYATIVSYSGLPRYPAPGDTMEVEIRVDADRAYGGILWGVPIVNPSAEAFREDDTGMFAPPGYELYVDYGGHHNIILCRLDGGGDRPSAGEERLLNWDFGDHGLGRGGERYTIRIDWGTGGVHHVTAFESDGSLLREGEATSDVTYALQGGVGFVNNSSRADGGPAGRATIDDFRIV